eukprot:TRINITY_DN16074_c0_g1_i1.p1 TRINITY_DN16074_c0_g1~~TRINITY_DN16074_c0_g1_i1.p1  ORF type:complete len:872 (+),score=198.79 TRINITY_DN16074_c0_g1_i1:94-2709(+)
MTLVAPLLDPVDLERQQSGEISQLVGEAAEEELTRPKGIRCLEGGNFLSPVLAVILGLPVTIACVAVELGGVEELKMHFDELLGFGLLSMAVSSILLGKNSAFPTCSNVDFLTASAFGQMAAKMSGRLPAGTLTVHLVVTQFILTTLVGLLTRLLAAIGVLQVAGFVPFPVVSGFNCASALLILDGGLGLGSDKSLVEWAPALLSAMSQRTLLLEHAHLAVTLCSALVFVVLNRTPIPGSIKIPFGLLVICLLFFGAAWSLSIPYAFLVEEGFFLENLSGSPWYAGYNRVITSFWDIQWTMFLEADYLLLLLPFVVLVTFNNLLSIFSYQQLMPTELPEGTKYSLTTEMNVQASTNIIVGLLGGIPMVSSLKYWLCVHHAGSSSRLWVVAWVGTLSILYFFPQTRLCLSFVPKCAFSGLVVDIGFEFFVGQWRTCRRRIAPAEFRFVVATLVVTFFNVFAGILLGVLLSSAFFLIEYSQVSGLIRSSTLADIRSFMQHSSDHSKIIDKYGANVQVFWCSGYIFFGTASRIVSTIREQMDENRMTEAVIVDFEYVPAVDASGVSLLMELLQGCASAKVPIRVCFCGMTRRLRGAMQESAQEWQLPTELVTIDKKRIEGALSWAEDILVMNHAAAANGMKREPSVLQRGTINHALDEAAKATEASEALRLLCKTSCLALLSSSKGVSLEAIDSFVEKALPKAAVVDHAPGAVIAQEGELARRIIWVQNGSVALAKNMQEDSAEGLARHHLNEQKGDLFVFEERTQVRVKTLQAGEWVGAVEFCSTLHGATLRPKWTLTAQAGRAGARTLQLSFTSLREAMQTAPAIGMAVCEQVSHAASILSLELLGSSRMLPYRSSADATFLADAATWDEDA